MDIAKLIDEIAPTPAEAARKLGISDGHIHDLRKKRRRLTLRMAAKIEAVTGRRDVVQEVAADEAARARADA